MQRSPFSHDAYLEMSRRAVLQNQDALAEIARLPAGVHAFGHNHLQWHMALGDKLFVNPGSCGMPLDFGMEAPYTILAQSGDRWQVTERRVPYDAEATIGTLRSSSLFAQAEIWSRIMIKQLRAGGDYITHFLRHAQALALERKCPTHPINNEIWRDAAATFERVNLWED